MRDDHNPPLIQGATLTAGGRAWRLLGPLDGSGRWCAEEVEGGLGAEVLWVEEGGRVGPWGVGDPELEACGRGCERARLGEGWALVFAQGEGWSPLAERLSGAYAPPDVEGRAGRWALVEALLELFEVLHELGGAWALRGAWDGLEVRPRGAGWEASWRWPERLVAAGAAQAQGWGGGLEAPEVAQGAACEASDVFLLGGVVASVLAGARLDARALGEGGWAWSLRLFDPGLPLGVEACVRRALCLAPSARFGSVSGFSAALRAARAWGEARALPLGGAWSPRVRWGVASDIGEGKRRKQFVNQDEALGLWDGEVGWGLFAVMDGVSRCEVGSGDLASWAARQALSEAWHRKRLSAIYGSAMEADAPFPRRWVEALCQRAHEQASAWSKMLARATGAREGSVACTTLTALGVFGDGAVLGGVGDSPAYVCARGPDGAWFVERVFVGHAAWAEAWRDGEPLDAALSLGEGLGVAVGACAWEGEPPEPVALPLQVELWSAPLRPGEAWLLASDGISDALGREARAVLAQVLAQAVERRDAAWAARRLVEEANQRGGHDNLTALVVVVERGEPAGEVA